MNRLFNSSWLRTSALRRFQLDDDALAITEYALLVAFAALAIVAVVAVFGGQITTWFAAKTGQVTTV